MHSIRLPLSVALTLVASTALAQELPQPSPAAKVEQTVGVTAVTVEYSSPGVKGREVLGKMLPLGEYWRAGANAATTVTFDQDVTVLGKKLDAGSYRLGMIPAASGWTAVFSTGTGSPTELDEKSVVAKGAVESEEIASRERLTYLFENTTDDGTDLVLEWSTFKVIVPISIDTKAIVAKTLDKTVNDSWRSLYRTGRYLMDQGDYETALVHLDKSLAVKESWWATWYKAQTLASMNKRKDAIKLAKAAKKLGKGDRIFEQFFKKDLEETLAAWTK